MEGWVDGWMDGWVNGWMDRKRDGWGERGEVGGRGSRKEGRKEGGKGGREEGGKEGGGRKGCTLGRESLLLARESTRIINFTPVLQSLPGFQPQAPIPFGIMRPTR